MSIQAADAALPCQVNIDSISVNACQQVQTFIITRAQYCAAQSSPVQAQSHACPHFSCVPILPPASTHAFPSRRFRRPRAVRMGHKTIECTGQCFLLGWLK